MIWFTADWHLNHKAIIGYAKRPFKGTDEMNAALIGMYQSLVKPEDTVYFLGDFALYTSPFEMDLILRSLPGTKILIMGNHDRYTRKKFIECGFAEATRWEVFNDGEFILVHDPAPACGGDPKQRWLVGHVHGMFKKMNNALNVGVDVWDYKLVSLDQVRREFNGDQTVCGPTH